jgi:hypothetical protein
MFKSVKMHKESYNIVKQLAVINKRSFTATLDIIIEYYKESGKCGKISVNAEKKKS